MIIVMRSGSPPEDAQRVLDLLTRRGVPSAPFYGQERVVITTTAPETDPALMDEVRALVGVERVTPLRGAYRLASREFRSEDTLVNVAGIPVGGPGFIVVAGPCIVESYEQLLEVGRLVASEGAAILRGDAYRSERSPYAVPGLGEEGLRLLARARQEVGLPVATEVPESAMAGVAASAADLLEIGPDNMSNAPLLRAVAETGRPVLLKRGLSATVDEWLMAAEHILHAGNPNVILCERGIRTFEGDRPSTLDLSAIAVAKRLSHLPVMVDPSHGTGQAQLVPSMALAAAAAGADGLLLEVHGGGDAPSHAPQLISAGTFSDLMARLRRVLAARSRSLATVPGQTESA